MDPHLTPNLFSVVIPTLNEGAMLEMTVTSILNETSYPSFEIVIVDDGSTDGSCDLYVDAVDPRIRLVRTGGCGVARARNLGACQAHGEFVVFLDAHCRVSSNWLDEFRIALDEPDVAVVGPCFTRLDSSHPRGCGVTWRDYTLDQVWFEPCDSQSFYAVPLTPGGCQALRREMFSTMGRYDSGFTRWGSEDVELCLRAWLMGFQVTVCPKSVVAHHFRESRNFQVCDKDILFNFLRMIHMHFTPSRIRLVLKEIRHNPYIEEALDRLYETDIFELRRSFASRRKYTDDWFFSEICDFA